MFKLKSKLIVAVMVMFGITVFMGCEKDELKKQDVEKISESDLENLTNAFVYSTNLNGNKSSSNIITDPEILEQRLLDDMSEKYGKEFAVEYTKIRPLLIPENNHLKSSLPHMQIDFDLNNETETEKFIETVFLSTRKLYPINRLSKSLNKKLIDFNISLENEMKNILVKSLKEQKIDLNNLNNVIYAKIKAFESKIRISSDISNSDKTRLLNGTLLSKVNLINTIEFADKYPLQLKKGWLKEFFKEVVKVISTVVITVTSTLVGMAVGSVTFNPEVVALTGTAGAVLGFIISGKVNKWIETW